MGQFSVKILAHHGSTLSENQQAVTLATPYGITHAAAAGGIANLLLLPVYLQRLQCRFGINPKRILKEQMPCLTATIAMAALVWLTEPWMSSHLAPIFHLAVASLVGAGTFLTVMIILARDDLLELVASFSGGRNASQKVPV